MELLELILKYVDEMTLFLQPAKWGELFLDHSKNEVLVLLYLYKYEESNMSTLSEYIGGPLNTTTGVVNRLIKKGLVERTRSKEDRRVVLITLTKEAREKVEKEIGFYNGYFKKVYAELSSEEISVIIRVYEKIQRAFKEEKEAEEVNENNNGNRIRKIEIE